jgi:hypothetical protein
MRRAAIAAVALLLVAAVPAQAADGPEVTGTYGYGGGGSVVTIDASYDGGVAVGTFDLTNNGGEHLVGAVKCLTVLGSDAWVAGIIIDSVTQPWGTWFGARLHDGGLPDGAGDMAITLIYHNNLTNACERPASVWTRWMVPVNSGDLFISE